MNYQLGLNSFYFFYFLSNILLLVLNEAVLSYPAEVDKESDYEYPDM